MSEIKKLLTAKFIMSATLSNQTLNIKTECEIKKFQTDERKFLFFT